MNIAIDARYIGMSGIGRVLEGILDCLDYERNTYYLVGKKANLEKYNQAFIIESETSPYTMSGLFHFPKKEINKKCDCILIPNFLIPFGIKIKIYTIVHDLIFLDLADSLNGKIDSFEKKYLLKRCFKKSTHIFCDSIFTLNRCKHHFKKYFEKCEANYIGISKTIIDYSKTHSFLKSKKNYIVFVGNVKPHKGVLDLINAFKLINDSEMVLKIIGKKEAFQTGISIDENSLKNIVFTGKISDTEMFEEIRNAKYLVLPSKYEGFGLPPLEALLLGTKPIISDIDVFTEIYSGLDVVFFKTDDIKDLASKIDNSDYNVVDNRNQIINKYNYEKCVERMLDEICR